MKKGLCFAAFLVLVLAARVPLSGYDTSPSWLQVVPEAIYAPATGGGTWATDVQITNFGSVAADIYAFFSYNGGTTGPIARSQSLPTYHRVAYAYILGAIDTEDPGPLKYLGKVGAVWFVPQNESAKIQVEAMTLNGNFGKSAPALNIAAVNSAAVNRPMILQHLVQNDVYRTFVGVHNTSTTETFTVQFIIVSAIDTTIGSVFTKTLAPLAYLSFNPFKEAGVPTQICANCWLLIQPTAGGTGPAGVMCYGSIANNYTNDTYALIARMYN
jgi:hypothetical protein